MSKHYDSNRGPGHHCGDGTWRITRRDLLKASGLALAGLSVAAPLVRAAEGGSKTALRFGMVTDPHYADIDHRGKRYYRESVAKMAECVKLMNEKKVEFLIELGDLKDQASKPTAKSTLTYLRTIEQAFQKAKAPTYHALGNHDEDSISKDEFLAVVSNTGIPRTSKYYSFDLKGMHMVVLDANYLTDGTDYCRGNFNWTNANVPPAELKWLDGDLTSTTKPVIVFLHQQLDGKGSHYVKNAPEVRRILQKHKKVLAVFQGHNHAGHYSQIKGIHYYTLKAMIEGTGEKNNSYAIVEINDNRDITVTGYRKAIDKTLKRVSTRRSSSISTARYPLR